ncbi:methyltransferase domain-containing protein [Streptomyces albipurpureus]|uniref:Methyltransferase domain-containing protein n=1 Tax=Streptomyces albipurpureus TaxID=2897419 RepID=A0ABT0UF91_9ACTN|nr:methyltransferase domain-containing protein [Streptomyces sp. CWNU-1]MCM2387048.1 methyltransferase domain-containing protein [Streptomyces sp. CWNU-1]
MDNNQRLLALLDTADQAPGAAQLRQRSYELLGCGPGARAVDVGCGGGLAVAELVRRGVLAIGVDQDERMIAAARLRHPSCEFQVANAAALPFADGSLDAYRADKLLHALDDPAGALAEARRVLAPGGRTVLTGQDWDLLAIATGDTALTRTLVQARADMVPSPQAARSYRNLLLDAGFSEVTVEVHTAVFTEAEMLPLAAGLAQTACDAGAVRQEEADEWISDQRARAAADRFLIAVPLFMAAGRLRGS